MNTNLVTFTHDNFTARTIEDNGEIWFVAKDVAQALGYSEATIKNAMAALTQSVPELWKGKKRIITPGGEQTVLCLSEQGLYFFLGRSDKKAALPYQMWIAGEVVPSIRKHGGYLTPAKTDELVANPDLLIKLAEALKAERARVAELQEQSQQDRECIKMLSDKAEEDKPKVIFAEAMEASKGGMLIGTFAKKLKEVGINVGQTRLFEWLREKGWLIKTWDSRRNTPTQRAMNKGFFTLKANVYRDAAGNLQQATPTTLLTGKGQEFFLNGFLSGEFEI